MSSSPNHCVKSFQPQKMGKQTGIQDVQSFTVYHKKRGFDRHTHKCRFTHQKCCGSINSDKDLYKRTKNPIFEDRNEKFSRGKKDISNKWWIWTYLNHQHEGFEQKNEDFTMFADIKRLHQQKDHILGVPRPRPLPSARHPLYTFLVAPKGPIDIYTEPMAAISKQFWNTPSYGSFNKETLINHGILGFPVFLGNWEQPILALAYSTCLPHHSPLELPATNPAPHCSRSCCRSRHQGQWQIWVHPARTDVTPIVNSES